MVRRIIRWCQECFCLCSEKLCYFQRIHIYTFCMYILVVFNYIFSYGKKAPFNIECYIYVLESHFGGVLFWRLRSGFVVMDIFGQCCNCLWRGGISGSFNVGLKWIYFLCKRTGMIFLEFCVALCSVEQHCITYLLTLRKTIRTKGKYQPPGCCHMQSTPRYETIWIFHMVLSVILFFMTTLPLSWVPRSKGDVQGYPKAAETTDFSLSLTMLA